MNEEQQPWYPCEECRALCCRNMFFVLDILKDLRRRFPGSASEFEFPYDILPNGQCSMLDTEEWKCKDYEGRPTICNSLKLWCLLKGLGVENKTLEDYTEMGLKLGCGGIKWNKQRNNNIKTGNWNDNC